MIQGSCLCGNVTFEVEELDGPIGHCHCRTCRKAHSAAFATTARVLRTHFHWRSGQDTRSSFESSPGKHRHFCSRCGSQLMAEWSDQPSVILRMGAVDTDPGSSPQGHIWVSDQVPWLSYGDGLPRYSEGRDSPRVDDDGG